MQAAVTIKNRFVHGWHRDTVANMTHSDQKKHRGSLYSVYLGLALAISSRDFLIDRSRQETTHWCKTFIWANAISRVWKENSLLFVLLSLSRFFLIHICCQSEILPTVSLLFVLQCNDLSIYSWLHVRSPPPPLQNSYTWPKFRKRWCKMVTLPNYAGVCGYFWNGDAHRAHHLFTCHGTYSVRWHKEACIVASEIKTLLFLLYGGKIVLPKAE